MKLIDFGYYYHESIKNDLEKLYGKDRKNCVASIRLTCIEPESYLFYDDSGHIIGECTLRGSLFNVSCPSSDHGYDVYNYFNTKCGNYHFLTHNIRSEYLCDAVNEINDFYSRMRTVKCIGSDFRGQPIYSVESNMMQSSLRELYMYQQTLMLPEDVASLKSMGPPITLHSSMMKLFRMLADKDKDIANLPVDEIYNQHIDLIAGIMFMFDVDEKTFKKELDSLCRYWKNYKSHQGNKTDTE